MLKEFLAEMKIVRSMDTYLTCGYLLNPLEDWLKSNKSSLEKCTYNDIYAYLESRKDWSNSTKWRLISTVKALFKWYRNHIPIGTTAEELRRAFTDKQRADLIVDMKYPSSLRRAEPVKKMVLTLDELQQLLDIADKEDYPTIYIFAYFGMRKSELTKINKSKKRIDGNKLVIETAKTYKTRVLYFNDYVGELLKRFMTLNITSSAYFNNMLNKYSKRLKIRIFPHAFRHTFINEMTEKLKNEAKSSLILKKIVGHTVSDVTEGYKNVSEAEIKKAMGILHYMNAIKKRPLEKI
jgi:integrase